MGYWDNKQSMAAQAAAHTHDMMIKYEKETTESVKNSKIYYSKDGISNVRVSDPTIYHPVVEFWDKDSATAARTIRTNHLNDKICILNFASYKEPGGKFIQGSSAQEESLCHASNLYNILLRFDKVYYAPHREKGATNRSLYYNEAIYTPNVIFSNNKFDILTCAAPNWSAASRFGVPLDENNKALKSRIEFIKSILEENKVDIAILGAWGAGVYGQDPATVATYFKTEFNHSSIPIVVYSIPDKNSVNYQTFKKIILGDNNDTDIN